MPHEKFHYKSLEEVQARAAELGVRLPFAADTRALTQPLTVGNVTFANRMGIAPMEGADSLPNGSPSDYTLRRYVKEAIGGSAIGLALCVVGLRLNEKRIAGKPEWTPRVAEVYTEKPEMDDIGCQPT